MTGPLDELRRLDAARSRGEWTVEQRGWGDGSVTIRCGEYDDHAFAHHSPDNAEWIAACSRLVPVLLDRLDQLEAAAAMALEELEEDATAAEWHANHVLAEAGDCVICVLLDALPSPAEETR